MRRTIVVGDIHGCLLEFRQLVDKLKLSGADRLVLVGDLMDKGPDPVGCVRFARQLGVAAVMGNHEEKHLRWRKHEDRRALNPGYRNPMHRLDEHKAAQNAALSAADIAWMATLPAMLELGDWVVVHGGLLPGRTLAQQSPAEVMRLRWLDATGKHLPLDPADPNQPPGSHHWMEVYDGSQHVVYGHAVHSLSTPRVDRNRHGAECWGIDTGATYGGRLTALVLETREVIQVQSAAVYKEPALPLPR